MLLDAGVGSKDELRLQLSDVGFEPLGGVTVWIVDQDVEAVVLLEPLPLLISVNVEVERIEFLQMLLTDALRRLVAGERASSSLAAAECVVKATALSAADMATASNAFFRVPI